MSLKELTSDIHELAEQRPFAKLLISGGVTPEQYTNYLFNKYYIYLALEQYMDIPDIQDIKRADKIKEDLEWYEFTYNFPQCVLTYSTNEYIQYIHSIGHDTDKILAHMYVRHFGDMFGGAMIAKNLPGPGNYYKFENKGELIKKVRALLRDDMSDEARRCFMFAIRLFEDLENGYDIKA